jgi:hypothetical protein
MKSRCCSGGVEGEWNRLTTQIPDPGLRPVGQPKAAVPTRFPLAVAGVYVKAENRVDLYWYISAHGGAEFPAG